MRRRGLKFKPKQLRLLSDEYKKFDLNTFRAHIHQEVRSRKETQYWIVKKQKKLARKAKAANEDDDGQQFFVDPNINVGDI